MYKDNMQCRLSKTGEDETQEHLEKCEFTKEMRTNHTLEKQEDKIVLWRKITKALTDLYDPYQNVKNADENRSTSTQNEFN